MFYIAVCYIVSFKILFKVRTVAIKNMLENLVSTMLVYLGILCCTSDNYLLNVNNENINHFSTMFFLYSLMTILNSIDMKWIKALMC